MIKLFLAILMLMLSAASRAETAGQDALLSSFMSYADLRIVSVAHSIEILASSDEAKSGDWLRIKRLLGVYQRADDGFALWYLRTDGSYYTVDKGLMNASLADRDYFPGLIAGRSVTGSLVISKSTGRRSAVIAVPIFRHGKVTGAIGASLFLDNLADRIASMLKLPGDAGFFALAPDGRTTLHLKTERHFLDPRELGSETLKAAVDEMLANDAGELGYEFDDATKRAIYRTSPVTGWKFAISFGAAGAPLR